MPRGAAVTAVAPPAAQLLVAWLLLCAGAGCSTSSGSGGGGGPAAAAAGPPGPPGGGGNDDNSGSGQLQQQPGRQPPLQQEQQLPRGEAQGEAGGAAAAAGGAAPPRAPAPARALQQQQPQNQPQPQQQPQQPRPAGAPAGFVIPVPPPGSDIPAEPLVPLYSPDQLRLRLPPIPDVPPDRQIISILEQMQQAAHLNVTLTDEQLDNAAPLLGAHGRTRLPERREPADYPHGYVAICAIVKDQHADLREWLEYHRHVGVGRVYVYDNNSTVPLAAELADMLHSGFVEYTFFVGAPRYRDLFRTSSQWWAYNDCVSRFRHRHRWLAFIDADEFLVVHDAAANATDLPALLRQYDGYGGLAVNWVVFGSSGHRRRPAGGVLANYRQCLPPGQEQNQHVKVVANTAHVMTVGDDPHRVYYRDAEHWTVNEDGRRVDGPKSSPPSHKRLALYHYLTKSEEEYRAKMRRGSAAGNYKSPEFFTAINSLATASCPRAVPLALQCCASVRAELGPDGVRRVEAQVAADRAAMAAEAAADAAADAAAAAASMGGDNGSGGGGGGATA